MGRDVTPWRPLDEKKQVSGDGEEEAVQRWKSAKVQIGAELLCKSANVQR